MSIQSNAKNHTKRRKAMRRSAFNGTVKQIVVTMWWTCSARPRFLQCLAKKSEAIRLTKEPVADPAWLPRAPRSCHALNMRKRNKALLLATCLLLAAAMVGLLSRDSEPRYRGRSLYQWLVFYEEHVRNQDAPQAEE